MQNRQLSQIFLQHYLFPHLEMLNQIAFVGLYLVVVRDRKVFFSFVEDVVVLDALAFYVYSSECACILAQLQVCWSSCARMSM